VVYGNMRAARSADGVPVAMRAPKQGDLIEMLTVRGLAYAQVTHKVPLFGTLIRVLEPIVPERPSDLEAIARSRVCGSGSEARLDDGSDTSTR